MTVVDLDAKILAELQKNGRIRASELATMLNISRITAAKRLNTLTEKENIIIVGVAHPAVLGLHTSAHISIAVDMPIHSVVERICAFEEVVFASLTSGLYPCVIEVRAANNDALFALIDTIRGIEGVKNTVTLFYTEQLVDVLRADTVISYSLDQIDIALIRMLSKNGRLSYTALSHAIGISVGTVRIRVTRLIDEGILRIGIMSSSHLMDNTIHIGVGIKVQGSLSLVTDKIAKIPELRFLVATLGQYSMVGTFAVPNLGEATRILDTLRAIDHIDEIYSWVHLKIVKEQYPYLSTV